jgi:hypothetical protein
MQKNSKTNKSPLNRVFIFISTYWKELSIAAIILPFLYRYYLNQLAITENAQAKAKAKVANSENKTYNPTIQLSKLEKALKGMKFASNDQKLKIIAAAKILPFHLGTQFFFENDYVELSLNHRSWTENDSEIEKILIANPVNYWIIEKLYHDVYTPSRNLSVDVLKYLDSDSLARVRKEWKKHNKFI